MYYVINSLLIFEFNVTLIQDVMKEMFVWLKEVHLLKVVLRFVRIVSGVRCVIMDGAILMLELCADKLDILKQVMLMINTNDDEYYNCIYNNRSCWSPIFLFWSRNWIY